VQYVQGHGKIDTPRATNEPLARSQDQGRPVNMITDQDLTTQYHDAFIWKKQCPNDHYPHLSPHNHVTVVNYNDHLGISGDNDH
jgi:hypothetical protein